MSAWFLIYIIINTVYVCNIEAVNFDKSVIHLASFRMQMWHAIGEKLKQSDPEAE